MVSELGWWGTVGCLAECRFPRHARGPGVRDVPEVRSAGARRDPRHGISSLRRRDFVGWPADQCEREEISRGVAAGESARRLAKRLGRSASTVSREIARNGGRDHYRAASAGAAAYVRGRRPKQAKLAQQPVLRALVRPNWPCAGRPSRSQSSPYRAGHPAPRP